jgi:hypothetical protein
MPDDWRLGGYGDIKWHNPNARLIAKIASDDWFARVALIVDNRIIVYNERFLDQIKVICDGYERYSGEGVEIILDTPEPITSDVLPDWKK